MKARAGNSLTKWDFQITNKTDWVEMGFLNYKRESRFTIHLKEITDWQKTIQMNRTMEVCAELYEKESVRF